MIYNLFHSDLDVLSIFPDNYRVQRDTRFETNFPQYLLKVQ